MRLTHGLLVGTAAAALVASCTFLVDFRDAPADASTDDPSLVPPVDAGTLDRGNTPPADAGLDAHPCMRVDGGKPVFDGVYCAGNGLGPYPGSLDDLITCTSGVASAVPCDAGCIFFRSGIPDACNECTGRANGKYCGSTFPNWNDPLLKKLLITCQSGRMGTYTECPTSCEAGTCK